jgi:ubiquinone/menaquinone biosynthesis C-methylase UbiE
MNPIVETYSELAAQYDGIENMHSCWGMASDKALASLRLRDRHKRVVDIGCGSGRALIALATRTAGSKEFIGIEPAQNMRHLASRLTKPYPSIRILDGAFETIPLETGTVDYLFSILAFHWTTDLGQSVRELRRVLRLDGEMDLFFIGRQNGQEFIRATTPIFHQFMGPIELLKSALMRKQLSKTASEDLFEGFFGKRIIVNESFDTYYDTLEGHWNWWVRIEGHFVQIPADKRSQCDRDVKNALASLQTATGIPYTIHLLHVQLRSD